MVLVSIVWYLALQLNFVIRTLASYHYKDDMQNSDATNTSRRNFHVIVLVLYTLDYLLDQKQHATIYCKFQTLFGEKKTRLKNCAYINNCH